MRFFRYIAALVVMALPVMAQDTGLMAACAGGDTEACLQGTREAQAAGDNALMLTFIRKGCALENVISCSDLGMAYLVGLGVEKDVEKAKPYVQNGCKKGYYRACANLGWMHYTGTGFPQSSEKALGYYKQGCEGGSGSACGNLGKMYLAGDGVAANEATADRYFDKACDLGVYMAC
ncbi:tetratricopeptide repeat protein [Roseovarius sp. 2305UL8-3]|uniref:tetratricopeptide repeat protein n=1 Tax=Roseovarius conchicola TaxID=3121636 RepID=UPI00352854C4